LQHQPLDLVRRVTGADQALNEADQGRGAALNFLVRLFVLEGAKVGNRFVLVSRRLLRFPWFQNRRKSS
jgi:hypothetical protein